MLFQKTILIALTITLAIGLQACSNDSSTGLTNTDVPDIDIPETDSPAGTDAAVQIIESSSSTLISEMEGGLQAVLDIGDRFGRESMTVRGSQLRSRTRFDIKCQSVQ